MVAVRGHPICSAQRPHRSSEPASQPIFTWYPKPSSLLSSLQVASVVGRAEVLACVFFLLSLLCYIRGVSTGSGRLLVPAVGTRWHYVLLGVFMCVCSLLSKEQGITALGVCAAFDVFLNWDSIWSAVAGNKHSGKVAVEEKTVDSDASSQNSHRTVMANGNHVHSIDVSSTCSNGNERSSKFPSNGKFKNSNIGTPLQSVLPRLGSQLGIGTSTS